MGRPHNQVLLLKMKGVVLAAGRGRRFGAEKPKLLARFFDKTLVEHAILVLRRAGIEEIVVVYSDERVRSALSRYPGVEFVYNEDVERGNGYSLLKAEGHVGGESFILLMGDHVFEPENIRRMLDLKTKGILLAVEKNLEGRNIAEATKVLLENDRVVDIGKRLKRYNAIDAGLFLCSPRVFEIAGSFRERFSVNDVMRRASREGALYAHDITGSRWMDVDTREDLKKAEAMVLRGLYKDTDGLVSRHLNRKISTRLTAQLLKTGVTPNQISVLSFLIALASGALFFISQPIAAGIAAQVSSVIDGCDGELARLRNTRSRFGAYFDSLLDRYADFAILLGMIAASPSQNWLPGMLALLGTYSISYTASRAELLTGRGFTHGLSLLMTRDMRLFLVMLGGILNQVLLTLYILAIGTNTVVLSRLLAVKARLKKVKS
jgi:CDP-L-myo-inositol myo-inositolphosphotransferase